MILIPGSSRPMLPNNNIPVIMMTMKNLTSPKFASTSGCYKNEDGTLAPLWVVSVKKKLQ